MEMNMGNLKAGKIDAPSKVLGGSAANCEAMPKSKTGSFKTPPTMPGGKAPASPKADTVAAEDMTDEGKKFTPEQVFQPTPHSFRR